MEEKYDLHVRVNMSTGQLISSFYRLACCKTQAEFVEKAVNFYAGYIAGNSTAEYVTTAVSESVKKTIGSFEKHMARSKVLVLYFWALETNSKSFASKN